MSSMNSGHLNGRRVVDFTEQLHLKNAHIATTGGTSLSEPPQSLKDIHFPPIFW